MLLVITLLATGLPLVVASAGADQPPALTVDICHPAQSMMDVATQCSIPTLTTRIAVGAPEPSSPTFAEIAAAQPRVPDAPEVPPPKHRLFPAG
jgi:hypothetical protein